MNVNEMLRQSMFDLIDDILSNGTTMEIAGEKIVVKNAWTPDGKLITLKDFMTILVNNDIRTFLKIKMSVEDEMIPISVGFKMISQVFGLPHGNATTMKLFRLMQKNMCEYFVSDDFEIVDSEDDIPTTDVEILDKYDSFKDINKLYIDLCMMADIEFDIDMFYTTSDSEYGTKKIYEVEADGIEGVKAYCLNEIQVLIFKERADEIYAELMDELIDGKFGEKIS